MIWELHYYVERVVLMRQFHVIQNLFKYCFFFSFVIFIFINLIILLSNVHNYEMYLSIILEQFELLVYFIYLKNIIMLNIGHYFFLIAM